MSFQWTDVACILLFSAIFQTYALHTVFRTRREVPDVDYPVTTLRHRYPYKLRDQWFAQRLDHFRPNNRTWYQRYWTQNAFYESGGPVFLDVTGEWTADPRSLAVGFSVELASQYNALMFQLEHRFYGKSRPTSTLNLPSLKYLTSEQALADAAHFIRAMNKKYDLPEGTKWIAFGASYAGNLVTWLRDKYPDLLYGSVASSAPVLAQLNFPEFLDEVRSAFAYDSEECAQAVEKTFQEINNLLTSASGQNTLIEKFGLCGPLNITNELDVADLIFTLADELPLIVEGGRLEISEFCSVLLGNSSKSLLTRYANSVGIVPDVTWATCTVTEFDRDVQDLRNDGRRKFDFTSTEYQWLYQMCTEFGYFTTSETPQSLLGNSIPMDFFTRQCIDLFGKQFDLDFVAKRVERTNRIYGGLGVNATRVIHIHGSLDPWKVLGITRTRNPESPAILIEGESHCTVDWSSQETDPPALKKARQQVSDILGQWLQVDPMTATTEPEPEPENIPHGDDSD